MSPEEEVINLEIANETTLEAPPEAPLAEAPSEEEAADILVQAGLDPEAINTSLSSTGEFPEGAREAIQEFCKKNYPGLPTANVESYLDMVKDSHRAAPVTLALLDGESGSGGWAELRTWADEATSLSPEVRDFINAGLRSKDSAAQVSAVRYLSSLRASESNTPALPSVADTSTIKTEPKQAEAKAETPVVQVFSSLDAYYKALNSGKFTPEQLAAGAAAGGLTK